MQHHIVVIIVIIMMIAAPVAAQNNNCDIDLTVVAAMLFQAQGEAKSGDTEAALRTIDVIQSALDNIKANCDSEVMVVPVEPEEAPRQSVELSQTFVSDDDTFTFQYPDGWNVQVVELPISGAASVMIGNVEPDRLRVLAQSLSMAEEPGEQIITVQMTDANGALALNLGLGDNPTIYEVDQVAVQMFSVMLQIDVSNPVELTINDQFAIRHELSNQDGVGAYIIIDLGDGVFGTVVGAIAAREMAEFDALLMAVAESLQYSPQD